MRRIYRRKYGSRRKTYRKKKVIRRKRFSRRSFLGRRRLIRSGFPAQCTVKLAYVDSIVIDAPSGPDNFSYYIFRANSAYDPDFTGTGHQPMGFDEYMKLYDHYQVKWSSIKVTNMPTTSNGNATPIVWGVHISDAASAIPSMANVNMLMEQRNTGPFRIGGLRDNTTNTRMNTIKRTCNIRKFTGNKDPSLLRGDATSNPVEDVLYTVWATARSSVFNPGAEAFDVHMEFIVTFTEPKYMTQS